MDGVASYSCLCEVGFTGVDCGVNINECESQPCQNDAKCNDMVCEEGF